LNAAVASCVIYQQWQNNGNGYCILNTGRRRICHSPARAVLDVPALPQRATALPASSRSFFFSVKNVVLDGEIVCPDERGCSQADTWVRTWVAATRTTSCQIGDNQWQGARPRKTRVQPCTRTGHFWGYWQTRPSEPCRSSRALRCSMLPFGRCGLSELRLSGIRRSSTLRF